MTQEERQALITMLLEAHNPDLLQNEGHVSQIWEDGEWTSQKGGGLLHQRTLHHFGQAFAFSGEGNHMQLPLEMYGHHCVVLTHEAAKAWIDLAEGRTHSKAGVQ
jgi:hypothetical protein